MDMTMLFSSIPDYSDFYAVRFIIVDKKNSSCRLQTVTCNWRGSVTAEDCLLTNSGEDPLTRKRTLKRD